MTAQCFKDGVGEFPALKHLERVGLFFLFFQWPGNSYIPCVFGQLVDWNEDQIDQQLADELIVVIIRVI